MTAVDIVVFGGMVPPATKELLREQMSALTRVSVVEQDRMHTDYLRATYRKGLTVWIYEHRVEGAVEAAAIWRLWSDVAGWSAWNTDIEKIEIDGPFQRGSEIVMTPAGQDPVRLRLTEVVEPTVFVDEARVNGLVLRTSHRAEPTDTGMLVTYRMEISGDGADQIGPEIGPAITADWPETMAALVAAAGG
jgi:hypothetical protein